MNENVKRVETQSSHTITLEDRKKMVLTAIVEVVSATDKTIITKTTDKTINIVGTELRVAKLNLDEGLLIVEGVVDSFKYLQTTTSKGIFKRIFK